MNMPKVNKCDVLECAYNRSNSCHALAITVGDIEDEVPRCDTFCRSSIRGGEATSVASVGACKVDLCKFNKLLECTAPGISVGYRGSDVDCLTFSAR